MATVLTLAPLNASVEKGKTQKFTATVTGVPEGGTTEYKWEVDGVTQASVVNTLDFVTTKVGTNVIKVTATTKVDAEPDDVQEATTNLTVTKITMGALSVVATPTPATVKYGEQYKIKCVVTGQPAGATIAYKWNTGETTQEITQNATTVGTVNRKCTVTVSAPDYNDSTKDSNQAAVTVTKGVQTTSVLIDPMDQEITQDQKYTIGVEVLDAPDGAVTTYLWSNGDTTDITSKVAPNHGEFTFTCTVKVTHANYEDFTFTTPQSKVTVIGKEIAGFTLAVGASAESVKVGEQYTMDATATATTSDVTFEYLWDNGSTAKSPTFTAAEPTGYKDHSVTVKAVHARYLPVTLTRNGGIDILPSGPVIPDDELGYVHPLPHRNSAFIWAGWWVMDEIEAITKAGGDWKVPSDDSKYKIHLATLAKMINDYPEVDVQESRHGRIVHRSALDLGIIYG